MAEINAAYDLVRAAQQHEATAPPRTHAERSGAAARRRPRRLADPAAAARARPGAAGHAQRGRGRPAGHADLDVGQPARDPRRHRAAAAVAARRRARGARALAAPSATSREITHKVRRKHAALTVRTIVGPAPRLPRSAPAYCGRDRGARARTDRRPSYRWRVREVDPVPNVELRRNAHGHEIVVFAFPYRADIVDAVRSIPGPALRLAGQGVVRAARGRHRRLRPGRDRALPGARGRRRGRAVAGARGQGLGRAHHRRPPRGRGLVRARRDRRRAARRARGRWPSPRRPALAAVHAGGRRDAAGAARRAHGPARAALRLAPAGRAGARAGDADAGRVLRRVALQARGQLGPGHRRRVRRAARGRGARPHGPDRPVPARAARALHPPARHRRRRQRPRSALERLRTEHDAAIGAVRRSRASDADALACEDRGSAASCARSSARASSTRSSRGGCSSPTSRAWARPSRRWRRWRRTTPTRRS